MAISLTGLPPSALVGADLRVRPSKGRARPPTFALTRRSTSPRLLPALDTGRTGHRRIASKLPRRSPMSTQDAYETLAAAVGFAGSGRLRRVLEDMMDPGQAPMG